jgi:NADH dehydrogenase
MGNRNRIITVFGGSGFVGRHLVGRLARQEAAIIRVACRHPGQAAFLKTAGEVGQIVPTAVDIFDDRSVATALAGADQAVNLIGILYESGRWTFPKVHGEAAGRIARLAGVAGVRRLVHLSALGADRHSASAYARSKAEGELKVLEGFPEATILRPSIIFGPEDGFFNRFGTMALVSPFLPLIGGGHTRLQPVYVGDVVEAIAAVLDDDATAAKADAAGKTYELGGPRVYTFRQVLELLLAEIQRPCLLLDIPWGVAKFQAAILEKLPNPMLTRDQVELLRTDNVVGAAALGLQALGITPTPAEVVLPGYLSRFRPGGGYCHIRSRPAV